MFRHIFIALKKIYGKICFIWISIPFGFTIRGKNRVFSCFIYNLTNYIQFEIIYHNNMWNVSVRNETKNKLHLKSTKHGFSLSIPVTILLHMPFAIVLNMPFAVEYYTRLSNTQQSSCEWFAKAKMTLKTQ